MTFEVDTHLCIACGNCEAVCPEVFQLDDASSTVILSPVPADLQDAALEAESSCPASAITHTS